MCNQIEPNDSRNIRDIVDDIYLVGVKSVFSVMNY